MYRLTWKESITPSGRRYSRLQASGHRTNASGCGSWPTARAADGEKNQRTPEGSQREMERNGGPQDLIQAATLAAWPTLRTLDHGLAETPEDWAKRNAEKKAANPRLGELQKPLPVVAQLAAWPTPNAGPQNDTDPNWEKRRAECKERHGNGNGFGMTLGMAATLGPTSSGSPAETGKPGQLNPRFSGWLMGYPPSWDMCARRIPKKARKRKAK